MFHYPCTFHEPFFLRTVSARYGGWFFNDDVFRNSGILPHRKTVSTKKLYIKKLNFRSWDCGGFSAFRRFGTVWIMNIKYNTLFQCFEGKKRNRWKFLGYSFLPTYSCLCFPPCSPPPLPIPAFAFLPVLFPLSHSCLSFPTFHFLFSLSNLLPLALLSRLSYLPSLNHLHFRGFPTYLTQFPSLPAPSRLPSSAFPFLLSLCCLLFP